MKFANRILPAVILILSMGLSARAQTYTFSVLAGQNFSSGNADGAGAAARFDYPQGIVADGAGNLYVADSGNGCIRKIDPSGNVTSLTNLYRVTIPVVPPGDPVPQYISRQFFSFKSPLAIALDSRTNFYVIDNNNIYRMDFDFETLNGTVTNLAGASSVGFADGTGTNAMFNQPDGLGVDSTGDIYVADQYNSSIRKVTPAGDVTTLLTYPAALEVNSNSPTPHNPPPPTGAFDETIPLGIALDNANDIYVSANHFTVNGWTNGEVFQATLGTTFWPGNTDPLATGMALDKSGNVYVVDSVSNALLKISPAGTATTLALLPPQATITSIALDSYRNIYLTDATEDVILKGTVETPASFFAGQASIGNAWDYLEFPGGVVFGYYDTGDFNFPYVYHADLGFEYFFDANDGQGGAYLYDFSSASFWYTSRGVFPYVYDFSLGAWLYYYPDTTNPGHYTTNPRYFYNFTARQIITR